MRSGLALTVFGLSSLIAAKELDSRQTQYPDYGSSSSSISSSPTSTPTGPTTPANVATSGLTGGHVCSSLMCIYAVVNASTVQYTLQRTNNAKLGWMATGFGSTMANTPMVIMWNNSDGTLTLSQRHAPGEVMPMVDSNPPRVATADPALSDLTGSEPKFVFTVPNDGTKIQNLIWAYGETNPGSSAQDANLMQHLDSGPLELDLTQPLNGNGTSGSNGSDTSGSNAIHVPFQPYQKMIIAHAVLCSIAFLVLMPTGALVARLVRTRSPKWFLGHWIIQFPISGSIALVGWALGIASVSKAGAIHVDDVHKRLGIVLFVLYVLQCALGGIIHFRPWRRFTNLDRPLKNYLHGLLGVSIIVLAFYQVRIGYHEEWPNSTGRGPVPNGVNITWIVWVILVPVCYLLGLAFLLPKQHKQERDERTRQNQKRAEQESKEQGNLLGGEEN